MFSERRGMKDTYKISGKFEQHGQWSSLPEDFAGTIIVDNEHFIGTMEERYDTTEFDRKRYVCGVKRGNTLVYFKVGDDHGIDPLVYFFRDYHEEGVWGVLMTLFETRFIKCGKASVVLETLDNVDHTEVIQNYQSRNMQGCWGFSSQMENYIDLLEQMIQHFNC